MARVDHLADKLNHDSFQRLRHIEDTLQEVLDVRKRASLLQQAEEVGFSMLAYTLAFLGSAIWFGFQIFKIGRWTFGGRGRNRNAVAN